ncbi:unnamed protein product [Larinioides sclopetarius]|uniref:Flavin-containing monooxygenase n=1 Tax=Larinioides sclopetarius TaxID=280406 RepID=A0AAV1YVL0_9ARAC
MAPPLKKIAIIGGGVSGLGAIAALKEEGGFEPVCFEKTGNHGGTWCYREESEEGVPSLMPTTIVNHSKEIGAFSNFPPRKEFNCFMSHEEMYQYVTEYAKSRELLTNIKFNTVVTDVKRSADYEKTGKWTVTVQDRSTKETTTEIYDGVLVCVGHLNRPKVPLYPGQNLFKGKLIHTHSLRGVEPYRNKNIVVVGMGCSGLDAAVETSKVAKRVYLSTRSGAFVVTRSGPYGFPYDYIFLRLCFYYLVKIIPLHFVSWLLESLYLKSQLNKNTYKIKPRHNLLSKDPVLNDHINEKLSFEEITQKPDIKNFTKNGIIFEGDTEVTEVDVVIMATGYTYKFPFLEDSIVTQDEGIINLYKCMFPIHLKHSTLAVIGFVLPFGPGFPVLELQCRYAVQVLAGKCKLPCYELMLKDIKDKYRSNFSRFAPNEKMSLRVDYIEYSNELASMFGAKPNLLKLLITDTRLFLRMLFGPSFPYQYRLQGPHCWDGARKAIFESKDRMSWTIQDLNENKENIFQKLMKKILSICASAPKDCKYNATNDPHCMLVYLSVRNGAFVVDRVGINGIPYDYDMLRPYLYQLMDIFPTKFLSWCFETGYLDIQYNHNLYPVEPKQHILTKDPSVTSNFSAKLINGTVIQKPGIQHFTEDGVVFEGETEVTKAGVVIMATGYTWKFPFLEEGVLVREDDRFDLYKCIFPINLKHPTLAIVTFFLPLGPGIPAVELQCRWVAQVFAGKCKLPSRKVMLEHTQIRYEANVARYVVQVKKYRLRLISYNIVMNWLLNLEQGQIF